MLTGASTCPSGPTTHKAVQLTVFQAILGKVAARRVVDVFPEINGIGCPTHCVFPFDIQGENSNTSNLSSAVDGKENPATSAKVNGAKIALEGVSWCAEYSPAFPILARHWGVLV